MKKKADSGKTARRTQKALREAVQLLVGKCPRLAQLCYWAGTSSISLEELAHRRSFDLDFHTRKALQDVRPILAEIQKSFPDQFRVLHAPDDFGSGFRGVLKLPGGKSITVEVLSNYEDAPDTDLAPSSVAPGLRRVSLARYLADKVQCVVERVEARDLVDIRAVIRRRPALSGLARRLLAGQDAALLAERLLAWTDPSIKRDLAAYRDVNVQDAMEARDMLLAWLKKTND